LRILFDNNVPIGVRAFLPKHEVRTILEMNWSPRIKNGELLEAAEGAAFDILVTSDQNIRYQQNLSNRSLAPVVLGSNIWNVVRLHEAAIVAAVDKAAPGSDQTIVMPIPPSLGKR
jgi:hypothetical protein